MSVTSTKPEPVKPMTERERIEASNPSMSWPAVVAWAVFWLAVVAVVYILKAV